LSLSWVFAACWCAAKWRSMVGRREFLVIWLWYPLIRTLIGWLDPYGEKDEALPGVIAFSVLVGIAVLQTPRRTIRAISIALAWTGVGFAVVLLCTSVFDLVHGRHWSQWPDPRSNQYPLTTAEGIWMSFVVAAVACGWIPLTNAAMRGLHALFPSRDRSIHEAVRKEVWPG
jgi:hypothetical protein